MLRNVPGPSRAAAGRFDDALSTIDKALSLLSPGEKEHLRSALLHRK